MCLYSQVTVRCRARRDLPPLPCIPPLTPPAHTQGLDGGYSGYGSGWGSGDYGWGEEEEVEVVEDRTPKYVNGKRVLVNSDITCVGRR